MSYKRWISFRRRGFLLKALLAASVVWFVFVISSFTERFDKYLSSGESKSNGAKNPRAIGDHSLSPSTALVSIKSSPHKSSDSVPKSNEKSLSVPHEIMNERGVIQPPKDSSGPGEMGKPVVLPKDLDPETKKKVDEGWKNNAFNQYVSDMISVHRSLPDPREQWCKEPGRYAKYLPSTSVVICFHNEAWSVLLRTVHSVLDRSPPHLLHEIILVDDFSDMEHLKGQLDDYMKKYPKVRIIHLPKREGLIRARIAGAKVAEAQVLTFLDSHCECATGWLEPLLSSIQRNASNVAAPVIEVLMDDTFEFKYQSDSNLVSVGGFDWSLQFNWHSVPAKERAKHKSPAEPIASPTMAGGLFSIDRKFFEKLGYYDDGFDIWGGENLELSFKTWMCGGRLEIIPCSHVGHIFRKRSPYKWRTGVNVLRRNLIRLAEVWLDEYKKYYYERIGYDLGEFGSVSARKQLRQNLGCKSFKWYLDNIYPELFVPGDAIAAGEIRNVGNSSGKQMCIDSPAQEDNNHKPVGLWPCHKQGGNQYWMLSKEGEIRRDESCLDYAGTDVVLYPCHGSKGNQYWEYIPQTLRVRHVSSNKCVALSADGQSLLMEKCDDQQERQRWKMENFDPSKKVIADH